jgi:polysaccharide deacetylase 2 family uncharacterized protein YibQ
MNFGLKHAFYALNFLLFATICFFCFKFGNDLRKQASLAVRNERRLTYTLDTGSMKAKQEGGGATTLKDPTQKTTDSKNTGNNSATSASKEEDMLAKATSLGLAPLKVSDELKDIPVIKNDPFIKNDALKKPIRPDASVSVIVSELGINESATARAFELPASVGFSFSPYSSNLAEYIKRARLLGHEVYLDFPAQTDKYPTDDLGPKAVREDKPEEENKQRLISIYKGFDGIKGLVLPVNESITVKKPLMMSLVTVIKEAGLALIYKDKTGNRFLRGQGDSGVNGITVIPRYEYVGSVLAQDVIDSEFISIQTKMADKTSDNMVIMPASLMGVNRLRSWLGMLHKYNVTVKPPSVATIKFDEQ